MIRNNGGNIILNRSKWKILRHYLPFNLFAGLPQGHRVNAEKNGNYKVWQKTNNVIFRARATNSERLTPINVLWHRVYEAHAQYQLASKWLSQWDHWRCYASLSIFWVELQYFAQLYKKRLDTPTNCVRLLSSMKNPFLAISAVKTPRQSVPARCHSGGEWVKEKK